MGLTPSQPPVRPARSKAARVVLVLVIVLVVIGGGALLWVRDQLPFISPNVTGTWDLHLTLPDRLVNVRLSLRQDANDITGSASGQNSTLSDSASGKLTFNSITLNLYGPHEIDHLTGNVSDGKHMSGEGNFTCLASSGCPAPFVYTWEANKTT